MVRLPLFDCEAQKIAETIQGLQLHWPEAIVLGRTAECSYDVFPYLFKAAFPDLREPQLQCFSIASKLYATSIFLHDKLYDPTPKPEAIQDLLPLNAMRVLAMQWEAYHLLHELFSASSMFWKDFRQYLAEFARSGVQEQLFITGNLSWRDFSQDLALDIAKAKNGVSRATLAGLAELSDARSALSPLVEALDGYNVASQMLDDLRDWKEDLRSGIPSLVLVRAAAEKPTWDTDDELEAIISDVGRRIFYDGHAAYVLNVASAELDKVARAKQLWPNLAWFAIHGELRDECKRLREDIERVVFENMRRLAKQKPASLILPPAKDAWQALAWQALRYIVDQWHLGFGEARHVMEFPPNLGFSGPQCQRGDTFQRALIADTLCDVNEELGGALHEVLETEVEYLLSRKGPDIGGWAYFPELPELPPDADDLAQIMQVLWSSGHRGELRDHCDKPLSIVLGGANDDGSFESWIIPLSDRTEQETRQLQFARTTWGTGADPEVVANLLYALALIDRKRYSREIERGLRYLEKMQLHDGSWESTWYQGPFYGTYVCLRLLAEGQVTRHSRPVHQAAAFLLASQNPDGGWGLGASSNALDTSLALLGLATVPRDALDSRQVSENISRALEFLEQCTDKRDGGLPSCKFIQMDVGRGTELVK